MNGSTKHNLGVAQLAIQELGLDTAMHHPW